MTFWTANRKYHDLLFRFLKFIGYEIIFTVISGTDKKYSSLKSCDKIVCQSERMVEYLRVLYPEKEIRVIYPWTDLDVFKPARKINAFIIPSVPYDIRDFGERGIYKIIEILENTKIKAAIIFRSNESYNYFKKLNLKNVWLINQILSNKELASLMGFAKIMPLIYLRNSPDMPLSAIEGLSSGCAIICTRNLGLSGLIKSEKCGITINSDSEILDAIERIFKDNLYNKNARRIAKKYFDKKRNIGEYVKLI